MRSYGLNPVYTQLASLLLAFSTRPSATVLTSPADSPAPAATARHIRALPVASHRHYHVNAVVRLVPLPFLWIGRDRVGAADLVERRGSGDARAYEFAAGSDPEMAPRRINRWAYKAEETSHRVTHLVGFIKESDEKHKCPTAAPVDPCNVLTLTHCEPV